MQDEIMSQINAFETKYSYDMSYAREVVGVDPELYARYYAATQIATYAGALSPAAHWAVRTLGVMVGDCGPCVQLSAQLGEEAGIEPATVRALISGDFAALPQEVALPARFARALALRSEDLPELREQVLERFGKEALIAVAFSLIGSSMYPTLKYALGHGHSCSRVVVAGKRVIVDGAQPPRDSAASLGSVPA